MCVRALTAAVIGAFLWGGSLSAEVIFDSDATINYAIDEDVWFMGTDDDSGDDPPMINVIAPADISGEVRIHHAVLANFSGGTIGGRLRAEGLGATVPAVVNFTGTRFDKELSVRSGAVANVSGGEFHGFAVSSTVANVSGGDFYNPEYGETGLSVLAGGVLNFSGGHVFGRTSLNRYSAGTISGGHLAGGLHASGSTADIFGGRIDDHLSVISGEIHLYGGDVQGELQAMYSGTIHVYGSDLLHVDSLLTGTLADGSPISVSTNVWTDEDRTDGQIVLHQVPEPAVGVMAIGALLAPAVPYWRRRRR